MSLYLDSASGTLTSTSLDDYLRVYQINEPSKESGNGTNGLTPLALAARNGHSEVVRILLEKGAEVDALSKSRRTPLWIMTFRGRGDNRAEIVNLLLKHGADAKYSDSNLHSGSTPLENELKQLKDPEVIQLLVQNGGKTDAASKLAEELNNPDIHDAMKSTEQRSNLRATIVNLITALILFILAWANSAALTGVANKVLKKFQISGNKDSAMAKRIAAEMPVPKTKEDFKKSIDDFVEKNKLGKFFKDDGSKPLLEKITSKALDLQNDDSSVLGQSTNTENLVKFALYQPVIYCDDSGSMNPTHNPQEEDRMTDQRDLVRRIASICTKIVPDDLGVHLRFINTELPNTDDLRMLDIETIMSQVKAAGCTEIGTNLRERILKPLLYTQYNERVKKMKRPLFVSIITDGIPYGRAEKRYTLRDEIIKCQDYLRENGLPLRAVVFQISQIGSDPDSKDFLQELKEEDLENVYITAQQLDSKFRELRENDRDLESWLFQTLLEPILDTKTD
ncbi:hypothetical protein F4818DRAFT_120986 [Hypoxylon cercidicola]|nr:hypothetical protein F4818DRAFT_120986 [Hypoxylon cercidicola]